MTLVEALQDRELFGQLAAFRSLESWHPWITWAKAVFDLPMDAAELELYRKHTGRNTVPKAAREIYTICGRRAGKTWMLAVVACFVALFGNCSKHLNAGERACIVLLACDRRQARCLFDYIKGILTSVPIFGKEVEAIRAESLDLRGNITIEVRTSTYRGIRGIVALMIALDELAFWDSGDDAANPDVEVIRSLRPAMWTVPDAKLFAISTPHGQEGALWQVYSEHFGKERDDLLVWQASAAQMNLSLSPEVLQREAELDPAAAMAEVFGQFRADIEGFISADLVDAATDAGVLERPPEEGINYIAGVDPSGGRADSFCLGISHLDENTGQVVLDLVRSWRAPLSPEAVTAEIAEILKRYALQQVIGDHYGGAYPAERFQAHGITYEAATNTRSGYYLQLLPLFADGKVRLVESARLRKELLGLRRKRGRLGNDSIDHLPNRHDDAINAAAIALVEAYRQRGDQVGIFLPPASMSRRWRKRRQGLSFEKVGRLEQMLQDRVTKGRA